MPTKKEQDDLIKELKAEIRALKSQISSESKEEDLTNDAMGIRYDSGMFFIVKLKYNPATGDSKVVGEKGVATNVPNLLYEAKKYLIEDIIRRMKEVR